MPELLQSSTLATDISLFDWPHLPEAAEAVYENVDGMEVEGDAAEADVRVLPADQYPAIIEGR